MSVEAQGEADNCCVEVMLIVTIVTMIIIIAAISYICMRTFISAEEPRQHYCRNCETMEVSQEGRIDGNSMLQKVELVTTPSCPVCLEIFMEDDQVSALPDCHHLFHEKCINPWLELHPTCPICRCFSPLPTPMSTPLAEVAPLREA